MQSSQTFAGPSASTNVVFDLGKGVTVNGSSKATSVQISYDAASQSYTVVTDGRSQSFVQAEGQATGNPGETRYTKSNGGVIDNLTLVTTPYTGTISNKYVGMAYWQHDNIVGTQQSTTFDIFAYGLDTPATAVPRTGAATFKTDIFGLLTIPTVAPRGLQGSGTFTADFLSGLFSTTAVLNEFDYITKGGLTGGLFLNGGGQITSGNGFSGNIVYENGGLAVAGTISGKFYGPGAEEMGASFTASDGKGSALSGAMTGQRDGSATPQNVSLTNILTTQRVQSWTAGLQLAQFDGTTNFFQIGPAPNQGVSTIRPGAPPAIDTGSSGFPFADLSKADQVASTHPNFDAYDKVVAGTPLHIELYKPGSANTELALTYSSFATYSSQTREATTTGNLTRTNRFFILYGLETPRNLLSMRTGTGRYDGVVYAEGASLDGHVYDVGGAAHFDVDFSNARYGGSLSLVDRGPGAASFGTWTFASTIGGGQMLQTAFKEDLGSNITPRFYGPDGQEIGATFRLTSGTVGAPNAVSISGVALTKRGP